MLSLLTAFYCKQFSGAFEGGEKSTLPSWIQLQKNECVSDKSSVKGTDELSRTQWQSQLNRKVPVCHRRHSCCNVKFNLLNFNSSEVLFCTFSPSAQLWIHVLVYMSSNICVWFYWFYITCWPTEWVPLNEILDYVLIWMCAALNERSQVFVLIRESPSLVRETDVPLLC